MLARDMKRIALSLATFATLASSGSIAPASEPQPELSARAARGYAFATRRCAGCHAIEANGTSLNPEAPPWEDIANRRGVTRETLRKFLRDSHNFPAAMKFTVDRRRNAELAAYMVTLQRTDFQPSE